MGKLAVFLIALERQSRSVLVKPSQIYSYYREPCKPYEASHYR